MKNEKIVASKPAAVNGAQMIIITTESDNTVWVPASQFSKLATIVTYKPRKAGEEYVRKDGTKGTLKADRNDFVGLDRVSVMENSTKETIDYMLSKGVTPSFNL